MLLKVTKAKSFSLAARPRARTRTGGCSFVRRICHGTQAGSVHGGGATRPGAVCRGTDLLSVSTMLPAAAAAAGRKVAVSVATGWHGQDGHQGATAAALLAAGRSPVDVEAAVRLVASSDAALDVGREAVHGFRGTLHQARLPRICSRALSG